MRRRKEHLSPHTPRRPFGKSRHFFDCRHYFSLRYVHIATQDGEPRKIPFKKRRQIPRGCHSKRGFGVYLRNYAYKSHGYSSTVYRISPETIVKLYTAGVPLPKIKQEIDLAKKSFVMGIPTHKAAVARIGKIYSCDSRFLLVGMDDN